MRQPHPFPLYGALLASMLLAPLVFTAAPNADLPPATKRAPSVKLAEEMARQDDPAPLPADLKYPFNPLGFDQPDAEEERAKAAAQVASEPSKQPAGDRQLLETIAQQVTPDGTAILPRTGESILFFRQKKLKVGGRLTITFEGKDYEVELTAIDRTTFTLRLNNVEVTRPIKPGKTP